MLSLTLLTLLAAPPDRAQLRLASPGLSYVQVENKVGDFFNEYFSQQLVLQGVRVTTKNEVGALLGFERQKQLLGCSENSSACLAEMAGALGVDGLITGSLAKFGSSFAMNLKIVWARDGQVIGAYATRVKGDEALLDWLTDTAKAFAKEHGKRPPAPADAPRKDPAPTVAAVNPTPQTDSPSGIVETPGGGRSKTWVIPAVIGGVFVVAGVGGLAVGGQKASDLLNTAGLGRPQVEEQAGAAATFQTAGAVGLGVGVAALGAAGALFVLGGTEAPPVAIVAQPGGGAVVWGGVLP
ncbi:MAG: hypothetical protein ACYC8T_11420 [Myxococcaceae bacterium]